MLNQTELQTPENWQPPKGKLLNPCVDAVFKAIFTSNNEKSKKALTSFLSAVLNKKISDVTVEPNELPVETFGQKQSRFDIVCMVDGNEPANIEIQTCDSESFFRKRIEYHSAHLLNHYVEKGSSWHNVPVTYQISIVNFIFDKSTNEYVSRYQMRTDDGRLLESRQNIIGKPYIAHRLCTCCVSNTVIKLPCMSDTKCRLCASETRISKGNSRIVQMTWRSFVRRFDKHRKMV